MFRISCLLVAGLVFPQFFGAGCAKQQLQERIDLAKANEVVETEATPTPKQIDPNILLLPATSLCNQLREIKLIHDRVPEESDNLYKALMAKGFEALPCLVQKISDRTRTHDPRVAPVWQHYVLGDTAVFSILDIASQHKDKRWEELMLRSLPPKYREEWKTNGVYAYFNYVSEPRNRNDLQAWWTRWLKENRVGSRQK